MKKVLNVIKTVFVWAIVALSVCMMIFTIVSVTTFDRNDRELFGYRAYIVKSDSMAATDFDAGSLIMVRETPVNDLKEGDIISFISQDRDSFGQTITHKIRSVTEDAQGNLAFVTYGTTTNVDDATLVTAPYVLGKYEFAIPHLGTFFNFLKTPQGYIVCIFIPFMLLILQQGVNTVKLFRRYKGEQMEEMNAEKARLEEERAQNARMMEELLALKAQLESQKAANLTKEDSADGEA
jgi:signal peptidase